MVLLHNLHTGSVASGEWLVAGEQLRPRRVNHGDTEGTENSRVSKYDGHGG